MDTDGLSPTPLTGRPPALPEQPSQAVTSAGDLTASAYLKITTLGSTSLEARGIVPLICVAGLLAGVVTAYIAAHVPAHDMAWFLGLAGAELALAGAVIARVTRRDTQGREVRALRGVVVHSDDRPTDS